jgi:glycosyltransferase involved in cell wall biosynthesis
MDRVSVVIPCYKQAVFLSEAIESVLAQSHPNHEIIVVDDGSPDHTAQVAQSYSNVRYIHQANQGVGSARNHGLRESRGNLVVFLDADDRLLPHHFEASLEAFRKRPDVAFVCGQYRCFGAAVPGHIHNCDPRPDHYGTLLRGFHDGFIGSLITVMLQRKVLLSIDGFKEDLLAGEDYEILLRILKRYPMHCHHQYVAEYRIHDMQMTRKLDRILEGVFRVYRLERRYVKAHPEYLEAYQAGIKALQDSAGEPLIWQMVSAARSANWKLAIHLLVLLLRFYPDGIANLLRHKLAKTLSRSPVARSDS